MAREMNWPNERYLCEEERQAKLKHPGEAPKLPDLIKYTRTKTKYLGAYAKGDGKGGKLRRGECTGNQAQGISEPDGLSLAESIT